MHRKYLLLSLILLAGYLAAGENDQTKEAKTKHEYNVEKLFKKLPRKISVYIIHLSVRPLNRQTTFEEFSLGRYKQKF